MASETRKCCLIGCEKDAEFKIYDQNDMRPDSGITDACEDHVGALLGSASPLKPIGPWHIHIIVKEEE